MPRLPEATFAFQHLSLCFSFIRRVQMEFTSFVIREMWVLAWQKLTVQRLPSAWVFSKLISLDAKNQVREAGRGCWATHLTLGWAVQTSVTALGMPLGTRSTKAFNIGGIRKQIFRIIVFVFHICLPGRKKLVIYTQRMMHLKP